MLRRLRRWTWPVLLMALAACSDEESTSAPTGSSTEQKPAEQTGAEPGANFDAIRAEIMAQNASIARIREALTEDDQMGLANTLLQLYVMTDQPPVVDLLQAVWRKDRERYPEINWPLLEARSSRVAVAHTLARSSHEDTSQLLTFIRESVAAPDELSQAQAVIALAFVGADEDVGLMHAVAQNGSDYAAEAAIKALAIRGTPKARNALIDLAQYYSEDPRKLVIVRRMLVEGFPQEPGKAGISSESESGRQ